MGALRWFKTIETPVSIELWEYSSPAGRMFPAEESDETGEPEKPGKGGAAAFYDAAKRRQRHYDGLRWEIGRLIDCNFDSATRFVTLTFKDNVTDVKAANGEFHRFVKRLNYRVFGTKEAKLKYLAVWERQKRGAVHYHMVLFSCPYIRAADLREVWGQGFVKVNRVRVDSRDNVGRYISKYFSKDVEEGGYRQKKFFRSQNLAEPVVERWSAPDSPDLRGLNVVFRKEYEQVVNGSEGFRPRRVEYVKIRKEGGGDAIDQ